MSPPVSALSPARSAPLAALSSLRSLPSCCCKLNKGGTELKDWQRLGGKHRFLAISYLTVTIFSEFLWSLRVNPNLSKNTSTMSVARHFFAIVPITTKEPLGLQSVRGNRFTSSLLVEKLVTWTSHTRHTDPFHEDIFLEVRVLWQGTRRVIH